MPQCSETKHYALSPLSSLHPILSLEDPVQRIHEVARHLDGHHDRVAAAAHVLGDLDETAPVGLLEVEEEELPVGHNLLGMQRGGPAPFIVVVEVPHVPFAF